MKNTETYAYLSSLEFLATWEARTWIQLNYPKAHAYLSGKAIGLDGWLKRSVDYASIFERADIECKKIETGTGWKYFWKRLDLVNLERYLEKKPHLLEKQNKKRLNATCRAIVEKNRS